MIPADDESAGAPTTKRLSHHGYLRPGNQATTIDHRRDAMGGLDDHPERTLIRLQEDLDFESMQQQLQRGPGAIVGDGRDDLLPAHLRGADAGAISITIESAGDRAIGTLCTNLLICPGQQCQAHQNQHPPAVNLTVSSVAGSCRLLLRYALVHRVSLSLESPRQADAMVEHITNNSNRRSSPKGCIRSDVDTGGKSKATGSIEPAAD